MSGERRIVCETDAHKRMKMFLGNTTETQLGSHHDEFDHYSLSHLWVNWGHYHNCSKSSIKPVEIPQVAKHSVKNKEKTRQRG